MSKQTNSKTIKTSIGGQAVIEGVMMRGPKLTALSVRMPDQSISTETWESLDEAEQSAIVNGMTQGNEAHEAVWQDLVQENIDGAKEMGVQFYTIDKTAFIEATQSLRDEFCAKSADNARYYEDFLSYVQA